MGIPMEGNQGVPLAIPGAQNVKRAVTTDERADGDEECGRNAYCEVDFDGLGVRLGTQFFNCDHQQNLVQKVLGRDRKE